MTQSREFPGLPAVLTRIYRRKRFLDGWWSGRGSSAGRNFRWPSGGLERWYPMVRTGSASMTAGPTLAVVAREAGVSVPTASKVVNGREDVAPETRRRVTEALERLGYVRRPRFDAGKAPGLVDLVVHSL